MLIARVLAALQELEGEEMTALRECPFCGCAPEKLMVAQRDVGSQIICWCGCGSGIGTLQQIREAWNQRASPDLAARLEQLADELEKADSGLTAGDLRKWLASERGGEHGA
jgi:hypothetical protein